MDLFTDCEIAEPNVSTTAHVDARSKCVNSSGLYFSFIFILLCYTRLDKRSIVWLGAPVSQPASPSCARTGEFMTYKVRPILIVLPSVCLCRWTYASVFFIFRFPFIPLDGVLICRRLALHDVCQSCYRK